MLEPTKLQALRIAAVSDDWPSAGEVYLELVLQANNKADQFTVETIAPAVLLRDSKAVAALVDQLASDDKA